MNIKKRDCRYCGTPLIHSFADLGMSPMANSYLKTEQLDRMEPFYPLHAYVCSSCYLVQLDEFESPSAIFGDYAYFSSYSKSWLEHASNYARHMMSHHGIGASSKVIEIASNDGYLLKNFAEQGVPVLGVEPAANVAKVAQEFGIPTVVKFFGTQTAMDLKHDGHTADLIVGNNVLAHVPDINDFVNGMKLLLKPDGIITMEFPHLMRLIQENQFDTIYHEHFSYLSLLSVEKIFASKQLVIFDVDELPTHGGSLRIYARHADNSAQKISSNVMELRGREKRAGLDKLATYSAFAEQVKETKRKLLVFLIEAKRMGKTIVAYGAPAKGNTLLNYCGIRTDFIEYTVDASPHKQDHFLPGTHIPIFSPDRIRETKPDYILILPWNLKKEIMEQMAYVREWGAKFITPIPEVTVH